MLSSSVSSSFSDAMIQRFLLAQLSTDEQSAFETQLLTSSELEHRVRLAELDSADSYAVGHLTAGERAAFLQKFLVTTNRQKQLEVAIALRKNLAADAEWRSVRLAHAVSWPRLAWRVAFAIIALAVVFAGALVIRREPQIVKHIIPKRLRPAAVPAPTPQAAHHSTNSSATPAHRDDSPPLPAHEASPQAIVLRANINEADVPVINLPRGSSQVVRLELLLERNEAADFSIVVADMSGEVVHNVPEIRLEAADRIDFDVQLERLKQGDFQVILTRINGEPRTAAIYYFRVQ